MKRRSFPEIIAAIILMLVLLSSCGNAFIDVHSYDEDITCIEDPNNGISPRISRIEKPAVTEKVAIAPPDFDMEHLLKVIAKIGSLPVENYFYYQDYDLKQTDMMENASMDIPGGMYTYPVTEITTAVEDNMYKLTFKDAGCYHTLIQDEYGSLFHEIQDGKGGTPLTDEWIKGSDGSLWESHSTNDKAYYYENIGNAPDRDIISYSSETSEIGSKQSNIYRNQMQTELKTTISNGQIEKELFTSIVNGEKDGIRYKRTATTNDITHKLMIYQLDLEPGTEALEYGKTNLKELSGIDFEYEGKQQINLKENSFTWQARVKLPVDEMRTAILAAGYEETGSYSYKEHYRKGDVTITIIIEDAATDNIEFTFPISGLPESISTR